MGAPQIHVQKYGGSSVGDTDRIKAVAERIKSYHERGLKLVVVVSAMGKSTDGLVKLAGEVAHEPSKREMDMLLSTGEQVSIALLSMALNSTGVPAVSFTGFQANILTDGNFSNARIERINSDKIRAALDSGQVCIVAGFQGVDPDSNITTLGRGGSDTSAVALAATLGATECEIFTDVTGVFTADPRTVPGARKLSSISYDEMLELASLGAGVLHGRAVEFAKKYAVKLHVRSSFNFSQGTLVLPEEQVMEKLIVTAVTLKDDETRITVADVPDKPGVAAEIFQALATESINVDMIVQSTGRDEVNTISFTVLQNDVKSATNRIDALVKGWGSGECTVDSDIAILSAVGVGMKSHTGIAAKMFGALAEAGVNIEMISTSEIKISCVIDRSRSAEAVKIIHSVFGLDAD